MTFQRTQTLTTSPLLIHCTPATQGSFLSSNKCPATGPLHFLFHLPIRLFPQMCGSPSISFRSRLKCAFPGPPLPYFSSRLSAFYTNVTYVFTVHLSPLERKLCDSKGSVLLCSLLHPRNLEQHLAHSMHQITQ